MPLPAKVPEAARPLLSLVSAEEGEGMSHLSPAQRARSEVGWSRSHPGYIGLCRDGGRLGQNQ